MQLITAKEDCTACGACVQGCPKSAIQFVDDGCGFKYPEIDDALCVNCGVCKTICPIDKVKLHPSNEGIAIAGFCRNKEILSRSTSGGFLTGIVKAFGGADTVIFGAEQLNDFSVVIRSVAMKDLDLIRRSKYSWSDTQHTFQECRRILRSGIKVVYSGMPCQIAGLYSYLHTDYPNLLTVEVVCHGPPSDLYWQKEREFLEKKMGSKMTSFVCRDKGRHWSDPIVRYCFQNGKTITGLCKYSNYQRIWQSRLISRPACMSCRYAFPDRVADISLADYWHVDRKSALFNHDHGTSVVFGNSTLGKSILARLNDDYCIESVNRDVMCLTKNAMHGPIKENPLRTSALQDLQSLDFAAFVAKYAPQTKFFRLEHFIARLIGSFHAKKVMRFFRACFLHIIPQKR